MHPEPSKTMLSPDKALIGAWLIALVSTLGALFLGEVMGRTPCVLCWYQRIAMFPLAVVLGIAGYLSDLDVRRYALPLAIAGGTIAFWHSLLFAGFISEAIQPCTQDGPSCSGEDQVLFGYLPLPYLSLAAFCLISLLLFLSAKKERK
jgi:disulfide bond formation protein DsbB